MIDLAAKYQARVNEKRKEAPSPYSYTNTCT